MRAALILLPILLSAGCLGGAAPTKSPVKDATMANAAALLTSPFKKLGPGADAESSVTVSPDGQTILVCSHGGFTQPSPVWASTDAGATFHRVEPQPNQPFDGDCDMSITPDGAWYIVYDTAASATVASSPDAGKTWRITYVDGVSYAVVDRPWIYGLSKSVVYLTYQTVGGGEPSMDYFAVSTDGGLTFVPHILARGDPNQGLETVTGRMIVDDGGKTIRVPMTRTVPNNGDSSGAKVEFAVSRDTGVTWTTEPVAGPFKDLRSFLPAASRAGDGTLYFSIARGGRGAANVSLLYSKDDGKTWADPVLVASNQNIQGVDTPWVDGAPDGSATLVWMNATTPNGKQWQEHAARVHTKATPHVAFEGPIGPIGASGLFEFTVVDHDAAGRAYVAYPLNTGPDCKETPVFPSQVGSQNVPRNEKCQYLTIENATMSM